MKKKKLNLLYLLVSLIFLLIIGKWIFTKYQSVNLIQESVNCTGNNCHYSIKLRNTSDEEVSVILRGYGSPEKKIREVAMKGGNIGFFERTLVFHPFEIQNVKGDWEFKSNAVSIRFEIVHIQKQ